MPSTAWDNELICLHPTAIEPSELARSLYRRTCRTDFTEPGFCALRLGQDWDSHRFRQLMVDLKLAMAAIHESETGNTLAFVWASRFDQQNSTRPHVDGGPDQNFLMLGYEPSQVKSELKISDYAKCAFELGMPPKEFLVAHNPMFDSGSELLEPYTVKVPCFDATQYQIICINNSVADLSQDNPAWQGTLHTATVPAPDESKRRVINSAMIASVARGTKDEISADQIREFVTTTAVRRRGYDKQHLDDDL